jgi:FkbM family methyltransferase
MSALVLVSPPRSKVSAAELSKEVAEYLSLGVRIEPGDTVLDVGANIGAFALRAAQTCEGNLRILAFEPSPDTFAALATNFERNDMLKRTTHRLFHLGLSSHDHAGEMLSFYDFARFPTNSTFHLSEKRREFELFFEDRGRRAGARVEAFVPGALGRVLGRLARRAITALSKGSLGWWLARKIMGLRQHSVRVDTLARVLAREGAGDGAGAPVDRIDLLKIDVEGTEFEILHGLDERTWNKVQQVVLETHDRDGRLAQIEALFRAHALGDIRRVSQKIGGNGREAILVYARRQPRVLERRGLGHEGPEVVPIAAK